MQLPLYIPEIGLSSSPSSALDSVAYSHLGWPCSILGYRLLEARVQMPRVHTVFASHVQTMLRLDGLDAWMQSTGP